MGIVHGLSGLKNLCGHIGNQQLALGLAYILISSVLIGGLMAWKFKESTPSTGEGNNSNPPVNNDSSGKLSDVSRALWLNYSNTENTSAYGVITNISSVFNTSANLTLRRLAELEGKQNFTNAGSWAYWWYRYGNDSYNLLAGAEGMTNDAKTDASVQTPATPREVEEADIVKVIGNLMYVLNPYKGLLIINISNPDNPFIAGRAKVFGNPVEMYVIEFLAFIVVTSDYGYWYRFSIMNGLENSILGEVGTRILVVNCLNESAPVVVKSISLPGFASNTRRVGDVIYAVTNTYSWWGYSWLNYSDQTIVTSISFTNPNSVGIVETIAFNGSSNQIHASTTGLFVAQYEYTYMGSYATRVTFVDISDPAGHIAKRGSVLVPGALWNRFMMDHWNNYFRIVTHDYSGIGSSTLWIYSTVNPDNMQLLGVLPSNDAGSLMATKFAGDRAYTIHLPRSIDPLDVLDLSN
ncbi:MAG: beta-propeller domain-containing protein, partial [Thermoplasmata archaeon]